MLSWFSGAPPLDLACKSCVGSESVPNTVQELWEVRVDFKCVDAVKENLAPSMRRDVIVEPMLEKGQARFVVQRFGRESERQMAEELWRRQELEFERGMQAEQAEQAEQVRLVEELARRDHACQLEQRRRDSKREQLFGKAPEEARETTEEVHVSCHEDDDAERVRQREVVEAEIEAEAQAVAALCDAESRELLEAWLRDNGFTEVNSEKRSLIKTVYPLHVAVSQRDAATVRLLLLEGADAEQRSSLNQTPLQLAEWSNRNGSHDEIVALLCSHRSLQRPQAASASHNCWNCQGTAGGRRTYV